MKKVLLSLAAVTAIAAAAPAAAQPHWKNDRYSERYDQRYNPDLAPASLNARQNKIANKIDSYARNGMLRPAEANRFMAELQRIDQREGRLRNNGYALQERQRILQRLTQLNNEIERVRNSRAYAYGRRW
jgi:hypothetical protein